MTLVEFLAAVKGAKRETIALSILYWYEHYEKRASMTAAEVKAAATRGRVSGAANINMPDVLGKAGPNVDVDGDAPGGAKRWKLTETGQRTVRAAHGLPDDQPEIEHSAGDLEKKAAKVGNADAKEFLEEAIRCVSVGALRAAIVFVWVAAVAELKDRVWATGSTAVTAAVQKANPKAQSLTKKDDLLKINEATLLQVAEDVGVIDKSEKPILAQALDTRNQSGHPNKYRPGFAKVKSHIEDITAILWV